MTSAELRARLEARLVLYKEDLEFFSDGAKKREFWATNQGGEAVIGNLHDIVVGYTRVLKIIGNYEQRGITWSDHSG